MCYYAFNYFTERRNERIGVQLNEAREQFTHIAESHAAALQVTYLLFHRNVCQYCQ